MKRIRLLIAVALLPIFALYVACVGLFIWVSFPVVGEPSDRFLKVVGVPMLVWKTVGRWI